MTIESAVRIESCPKCGSPVRMRRAKLSTGEFKSIIQCTVCRHYTIYTGSD